MVTSTYEPDTHQIWLEFGDRLRAFIARRVGNAADADDILQDIFVRVHRHAGSVERSERLVSWLFQVTRNAIADYYRSPGRREAPSGAGPDLEAAWPHAWEDATPEIASPEVRRELAACLGPMVEGLPPLYREAVQAVDLEGMSQHAAAARFGVSVSGMKSRVQRGRRALKDVLQACCQVDLDAGGRVADYRPPAAGCGPCACGCAPDDARSTGLAAAGAVSR